MMEFLTVLALFGALLYRNDVSLVQIAIISTLTSAFFFMNFLSRKALWYGLLLGLVLFGGAWYVSIRTVTVSQKFFERRSFTGTVQNVDRHLDKTVLIVKDDTYKKLIQINSQSDDQLLPGDKIRVQGNLTPAEDFITDTGRLFPYHEYLQSKNIVAIGTDSIVQNVSTGKFSIAREAAIVRFSIGDIFSRYVSFPVNGIMAGILVGYQGNIPQYIQDLFRTTGVLHVLVLSGENITLLVVFLSVLFRPVPFKIKTIMIMTGVVGLVLISGAGISAIRAGVMGIIALSAGLLRRSYVPLRALTIATLFFFLYSPITIFIDPGFQLSALATMFMIVLLPKIEVFFHFLPTKYSIREVLILAVCVPVFMLPYTMYFSGLFSLASPFANILMMGVTSLMTVAGALLLTISWCVPLANVVALAISTIGNSVIAVLQFLNTFPQLNTPPLAWWGVVVIYGMFFILVFRKEFKQFYFERRNFFLPHSNSSGPESQ